MRQIKNALVSVFHKEEIDEIVKKLDELNVTIYSTGGTYSYIKNLGIDVHSVESVTDYSSILNGRVKTLHPKIFGGILNRREEQQDIDDCMKYNIPDIDLVITDLYPFKETVEEGANQEEIIEKIDIGGISLIRAAAKNFKNVLVIPSRQYYEQLKDLLDQQQCLTYENQRRYFAAAAFEISSHYDSMIFNYFNEDEGVESLRISSGESRSLRYGENPHQKAYFFGKIQDAFEQLHGKELSYNNLVDIDAGIHLVNEFEKTVFAVLKHTNACGLAQRQDITEAWRDALAGDPVSAFGGILITNHIITKEVAEEINKIFFEVLVAPHFNEDALNVLKQKKNRILLKQKNHDFSIRQVKTVLNGYLVQDRDTHMAGLDELCQVTCKAPSEAEKQDLIFGMKAVKHTKSNAIVLAKGNQLVSSGVGQTSRVDALKQAIEKAKRFGFDLNGAVMASDAFFPFADNVEIAEKEGIMAVIQPGGSKRDQDSIDYCDQKGISMVFTGIRHFKH